MRVIKSYCRAHSGREMREATYKVVFEKPEGGLSSLAKSGRKTIPGIRNIRQRIGNV